VSFSPALTDLLYDLGLGEHVVGVTRYCNPPDDEPPRVVGDRDRIQAETVLAVEPDVLLVQSNPDEFAAVKALDPSIRIEHFKIETLADVAAAVGRIGEIVGARQTAELHRRQFLDKLKTVRERVEGLERPRVLFVMGTAQPSTGGRETFLGEMIELAGGVNAASARGYHGWKRLNRENILAMTPEVLICMTTPEQVDAAREYWQTLGDLPAVRQGRVHIVTDPRWTIPSLRSASYAKKLAEKIHPELAGHSIREPSHRPTASSRAGG
jgi:iron complex transport system substrate-binding protein